MSDKFLQSIKSKNYINTKEIMSEKLNTILADKLAEKKVEVAKIVTCNMGLGTKSAVAALLHDVPDKTEYDLEDIGRYFGNKIAEVVSGLIKIKKSEYFENNTQASQLRQILLAIPDDIRVIFIKLADRLHNIRTLKYLYPEKQKKSVHEILNIYAPLAHRLGLYNIKSEMEDLCLKYKNPFVYSKIQEKLKITERERLQFINKFAGPIREKLEEKNIDFEIKSRSKSIHSIWLKMQKKNIPFEEVYDLFALRIIFKPKDIDNEKFETLYIGSLITDIYHENTDRTRNWLDKSKDNGYRALHLTVMSKQGRWVEVQIRSEQMNDTAEFGLAAHWVYKGLNEQKNELDNRVKEILKYLSDNKDDAVSFLDNLKISLFTSEIYVFTPAGHFKTLPKGATVLDFAFKIHTELACKAIAAKINGKVRYTCVR